MAEQLTTIREGLTAQQAESYKRLLAERNVEARAAPSDSVQGEWDLLAPDELAGRAARFLELADEQQAPIMDDEMILDVREWAKWPRCPVCEWPRVTRCQYCGTTSNAFPVADGAPDSEYAAVLLMCETCDEPFEPQFLDHCDRCNEPFGDGIEFPEPANISFRNPRIYAAAAIMVAITALLFAYWCFVM